MILLEQFTAHWHTAKYTSPGQEVLLAVSGGEDSMVMCDLFFAAKIPFAVAHCNYGLRGEDSEGDEQFVKAWCSQRSVKFYSVKFDTKNKAKEWKKGIQETARILRYDWFEQIRSHHNYNRIATAHHANDNMETLLINLFKGTGISGLHGIRPENGYIVRPLLFATKEMISAYAAANEIGFREDVSNASDDYLRNAVRHNIVPVVKDLFPNAVTNVNESILRFAQTEQIFMKAIESERKKLLEQRGQDIYLPIRKFITHPQQETLCYELFRPYGFTSGQVPHILSLLTSESGRFITSDSHRIIKDRDFLIITNNVTTKADFISIESVPCAIHAGKYSFSFSVQKKPDTIPTDANEAWLDMKHIVFPLTLRPRKQGDYLYPLGMKMKKKKVSRLLIDMKVPVNEKDDVLILQTNKRIAWVSGIRIDERYRITENTESVLVVKCTKI